MVPFNDMEMPKRLEAELRRRAEEVRMRRSAERARTRASLLRNPRPRD